MDGVELARGSLSEQPWGLTLGALARRAATGELTIADGALRVVLAFDAGRLVAAASTMRAASLLERAARTFELTRGSYTITDQVNLRPERGARVDLRAVVFAGARKYLPDDRLGMELRELGSRYMLASASPEDFSRYGLETSARIIDSLREGATLSELEARYHDVDGRELRAAIYALVCCGSARGLLPARAPTSPGSGRTPTPNTARTPTPNTPRTPTPTSSRTITPATSRAPTPSTDRTPTRPDKPSAHVPNPSRTITPNTATRSEATPVPLARIPSMNVARSKTPPDVARTKTPPDPARTKTPPERDRPARQSTPAPASLGRTPTRVTPAGGVAIIGGPPPRITPASGVPIASGGVRAEADAAAERARRHLTAGAPDQAVRETAVAVKLAPDNFDHQALHAWATFLAARDRPAAAEAARKVLEKASHRASAPNEVRFLLARLERIIGREREALRHFKAVLEREPGHAAAATELRELEAELEAFARR